MIDFRENQSTQLMLLAAQKALLNSKNTKYLAKWQERYTLAIANLNLSTLLKLVPPSNTAQIQLNF